MLRPQTSFVGWKLLALFAVLPLTINLGCTKSGSVELGGSGAGSASKKQFVTVGTAPAGGAFAPVGNAIASVVEANKGDLNWTIAPQGTKGTQENIRKLEAGEIEFGMANAAISYFATRGEG
ncbi:MAG: TAXI family TRAP transporter solute-binding subunit, partial [Mariniblastus sp.]|nr:TAXI family TRAP transporter solute-binding subunit [Mariniblastus sp.]